MKITESKLRQIIREVLLAEHNKDQIPIHDAPVTFEFVEENLGGVGRSFYVEASHPGTDRVGFITAIPYWDELTVRGMSLPKRTMKGHKDVEIYTVDLARLDKIFKGEGLGTQMYKFLVANLSKRNIALVPAEWTRHSDRKSKNSLALHMMDNESEQFPVGERGTSHDALRVWRKFKVPAFYPEWNPEDYRTFQSTRKRGWEDRIKSKRNDFSIEEALLREIHITPDNLPDGVKFTLYVSATGGSITLYASQDFDSIGNIVAYKTRGEENPCLGAYEIRYSKSEMDGLGPLMYDIVMEIATELGGGLISDRHNVSTAAQRVWQKYQDERPEVERLQLDSPENELTRTRKDNCSVNVSKNLAGDDLPAWRDHPLSGAYRVPGMPMIRRLVSQGKLEIKGFEL